MSVQMKTALAVAIGCLAIGGTAQAAQLKEIGQIPVQLDVPLAGFDISWVDPATNQYVLTSFASRNPKETSNPGNNGLLVFDAVADKFIKIIHGVRGSGVTTADNGKQAWLGNGGGTIQVVDIEAGKLIEAIPTGANEGGGDELTYDAKDGIIAAALPDNNPPTLILIDQKTRKITARIEVPEATDGLEQTVYSPADGMFWSDVPEVDHQKTNGGMLEVNPKTGKRIGIVPLPNCRPHGNAVGQGGDLFLGCNFGTGHDGMSPQQVIFNVKTGNAIYVPGAGGTDETAADNGLGLYYSAAAGMNILAVFDAKTHKLIQTIPTKGRAHSVTVDPNNHHVFLPESGYVQALVGPGEPPPPGLVNGCGCIRVFAPE
jgi:hypothetical protein